MTFNSILDLTFPRVEARWIITYRSSPTGFSRFLLRGGRRSLLSFAEHLSARQSLLLATGELDPPSSRFQPTSTASIFSVITFRLVRVNTPPAFFLPLPPPPHFFNRHSAPRVEQKPRERVARERKLEFGSFFLTRQPQFSFNWIV